MPELLRADFHVHTKYSMDCQSAIEDLIERCLKMKINCVNIADHGTTEGGLKMQEVAPFKVIVSEEILTPHGEIMGMFLKETVPSHISVEEGLARIREQGGLVCLPHPFDPLRGLRLSNSSLEELIQQADVLEVFNARAPLPLGEGRARALADKYGLGMTAGSDAHSPTEIGRTYVEMPDFRGKDDFLEALKQGRLSKHRSNPMIHFRSTWARLKKKLL